MGALAYAGVIVADIGAELSNAIVQTGSAEVDAAEWTPGERGGVRGRSHSRVCLVSDPCQAAQAKFKSSLSAISMPRVVLRRW